MEKDMRITMRSRTKTCAVWLALMTMTAAPLVAGGATWRVSVSSASAEGNGYSFAPKLSKFGRYVAFDSWATNLVPGDSNNDLDVFVRDRMNSTTMLVSVSSSGQQGNRRSQQPAISDDGMIVAFASQADNLVPEDHNGSFDVFVRN